MPAAKELLSAEEQDQIVQAIKAAEKNTSGEIRVHMEMHTSKDPLIRAEEIFLKLGMQKTAMRNAVLIYVAVSDHKLAIIGDKGLNDIVGNVFWVEERDLLVDHFTRGEYATGLVKAIELIGVQLKKYFPYKTDDKNELPDQISFKEKQ